MGIASALLGENNPFAQWANQNSNFLGAIGAGLGQGQNLQGGLAAGLAAVPQAKQLDQQAAEKLKADKLAENQANATQNWLQANHPDLAQMVQAGMPVSEAWSTAMQWMQPQGGVDPIRGISINDRLVNPVTGELMGDFSDPAGDAEGGVEYGVNPIYGRLEDGTMGMGVIGKDGTLKRVDTGGLQVLGPYDTNALKAAGTAFGKGTGGAQFDAPGAKLIADQTLQAVEDVRAQRKGMEEQFGNILGIPQQAMPAMWGSDKAKFQVATQRLTNRAFLEAREMLRGGGQITDFESKKAEGAITSLEDAMARGDKVQFERALADFEQAVKDGVAKLELQASAMPTFGGATPQMGGGDVENLVNKWLTQ